MYTHFKVMCMCMHLWHCLYMCTVYATFVPQCHIEFNGCVRKQTLYGLYSTHLTMLNWIIDCTKALGQTGLRDVVL